MDQITIPAIDDDRTLRNVTIDAFGGIPRPYRLHMWDTYRTDRLGKSILGYAFYGPDGAPIFVGEDFGAPAVRAIDSDEVLRCLLGFLTLGIGDTDSDYFASYTPAQIAFRDGPDREGLSWYAMDPDPGEEPFPLVDVE